MSGDGKTTCQNAMNIHNKGLICISSRGCRLDRQKDIPGSRLTGCRDPMVEIQLSVCTYGERDQKLKRGAKDVYNCKKEGECGGQVNFGNGKICKLPLEKGVQAEPLMM